MVFLPYALIFLMNSTASNELNEQQLAELMTSFSVQG